VEEDVQLGCEEYVSPGIIVVSQEENVHVQTLSMPYNLHLQFRVKDIFPVGRLFHGL